MNLADAQSTEAAQAQDLLAQALRQMQAQRWDEAMQLLESAIPIAPAELRAPAVAMLCAAAGIGIEAGVLERVLAALLAAGRRGEALELVQVLQSLPESEERPVRRWMRLLGAVPREAAAGAGPSQDKVERFLQCAQ